MLSMFLTRENLSKPKNLRSLAKPNFRNHIIRMVMISSMDDLVLTQTNTHTNLNKIVNKHVFPKHIQ